MRLDHRLRRLQGRRLRLLLLLLLCGSIQLGCKGWLRNKVLQRRYSALREEASRLHLLCLCSGLPISRCRTHGRHMLEIDRGKLEARLPWVWQRLLAGQGGQQWVLLEGHLRGLQRLCGGLLRVLGVLLVL